jgi:hypothetical protein
MWARRQAHETAIHRFDAESATSSVSGFDPTFASDGIGEILTAMAPRADELPLESGVTMCGPRRTGRPQRVGDAGFACAGTPVAPRRRGMMERSLGL